MIHFVIIGIILTLLLLSASLVWANGIDDMKNNHPDYKGDDLFNNEDENN
jgi:hypothetical protein